VVPYGGDDGHRPDRSPSLLSGSAMTKERRGEAVVTQNEALRVEDTVNDTCPWSGKPIAADSLTRYRGAVVGFCNPGCRDKFEAAVKHFEAALAKRDVPLLAKGLD
jgi:hypothetical protein